MPRIARYAPKGLVYHALNRAVARLPLFQKEADYEAFERVLDEAHEKFPVEILAYCVMPNHWHFVLRPTKDGQLTEEGKGARNRLSISVRTIGYVGFI